MGQQQGYIIKIDLNPRKEHEQQGFCPVIVLINNIVLQYTDVVITVPIPRRKAHLFKI
jgi:mRNA-degrading endonuclease toxin of MazEF toxin-antitoxin module